MNKQVIDILRKHALRLTNCRKQVIEVLLRHNYAIGQPNLEKSLQQFDRVTIYRTLNTFLEKGIIHKVLDDGGATKYALCSTDCDVHKHEHEHVHFKCLKCAHIHCIDAVKIPTLQLPPKYVYVEATLLVRGICDNCNV